MGTWSYFGTSVASVDEIRADLWNPAVGVQAYTGGPEQAYQAAILEQYKMYAEMADRISARRAIANAFFLSLNTAVLAVSGGLWQQSALSAWVLLLPLFVLMIQAGAWFWLIRSYRQLNSAKYAVVGALEERLPASPYWRAEWSALGRGQDKTRYWPLTHLEQGLPIVFVALYLAGFIAAVISGHTGR